MIHGHHSVRRCRSQHVRGRPRLVRFRAGARRDHLNPPRFGLHSFSSRQILLDVFAPGSGTIALNGRFNNSSPEAALASILSSFVYTSGAGASLTIGGLNLSANGLVASLDSLTTTGSSDTIIGYSFGEDRKSVV